MRIVPFMLMAMLTLTAVTSRATRVDLEAVLKKLDVSENAQALPPAPIPGYVEVTRGMQVLYVSADGELVINGDILSTRTKTNLTENRRANIRRERLQSIADDETLIVPASAPTIARIIVFTDTNCPYCLRLHQRREELSGQGIEIQYLFYPRSGPGGASFDQAVSVWCSDDRLAALERALGGSPLPRADCVNPVLQHYNLARELELKGTPAVITTDGDAQYGLYSSRDIIAFAQGRL
jgi:thiol:disulfide interchange protein DsbC